MLIPQLMVAAKAYRNALLAMSSATAAFATALEACSRQVTSYRRCEQAKTRVKGCRESNSPLAGASGLQYLVSNHEQILADTVYRQFEIPLLEALDHYKLITADRLVAYEKTLTEQSAKIRKTEAASHKIGRRRKRDLQQFRTALAELQAQVDELDAIKAGYHEEVLEGEDEVGSFYHTFWQPTYLRFGAPSWAKSRLWFVASSTSTKKLREKLAIRCLNPLYPQFPTPLTRTAHRNRMARYSVFWLRKSTYQVQIDARSCAASACLILSRNRHSRASGVQAMCLPQSQSRYQARRRRSNPTFLHLLPHPRNPRLRLSRPSVKALGQKQTRKRAGQRES